MVGEFMSNWNLFGNNQKSNDSEVVKVQRVYSSEELAEILNNDGYSSIKFFENKTLAFTSGQWSYVLTNEKNTLQIALIFNDHNISLETLNEWNSNYSFARAYTTDGGAIYLDYSLDLQAGVSKEQISRFIKKFIFVTNMFFEFLFAKNFGI